MNDDTHLARARWADWILLSLSGVLLLPILVVALAPCLLTLMVLWPLLAAPTLAARTLGQREARAEPVAARRALALDLRHPLPQK